MFVCSILLLLFWASNHKLMRMMGWMGGGVLGGVGASVLEGIWDQQWAWHQHQSVRMSLAGEGHSRLAEMTTAAAIEAAAAAAPAAAAAAAVGSILVQCAFRGVCVRLWL